MANTKVASKFTIEKGAEVIIGQDIVYLPGLLEVAGILTWKSGTIKGTGLNGYSLGLTSLGHANVTGLIRFSDATLKIMDAFRLDIYGNGSITDGVIQLQNGAVFHGLF